MHNEEQAVTRDDAALLATDRPIGPNGEPTAAEELPSVAELQERLFALEQAVIAANTPVAVVFEGWAGADKVRMIAALTRRLDPRGTRVYPISPPRTSETRFPWLFRFWLKTPRYGQMVLFDRSWYREVLAQRVAEPDSPHWLRQCRDICAFERQLLDDGALLIKFWLDLSRDEQARRFKKLLADPLTSHRVTDDDLRQQRHYKKYSQAVDDLLARTSTARAPWHRVNAAAKRQARSQVLTTVIERIEDHLSLRDVPPSASVDDSSAALRRQRLLVQTRGFTSRSAPPPTEPPAPPAAPAVLRNVRLDLRLDEAVYDRELKLLQARIYQLGLEIYRAARPVVILFEGWDAAGKGGAIQRLTAELDPRSYVVHAIAAPTGEDSARHYLYRFWRRLPMQGQIAIFDRSWYGRVLVERVEDFAGPAEWRRAYDEINVFEQQLTAFGTILLKFWLHISPEEQLRRFEARRTVPYKSWKLTDEDWRNREKWHHYESAADEMLLRTGPGHAPWCVVEAEDKRFARIKVLRTVVTRLEEELGVVPPVVPREKRRNG
jgi:AMP-polyphosphate phosphotransferase